MSVVEASGSRHRVPLSPADALRSRWCTRPQAAGTAVVLVSPLAELHPHHEDLVQAEITGQSLLLVGLWRSLVYVGPLWTAGTTGCPTCLGARVANTAFGPTSRAQGIAQPNGPGHLGGALSPSTLLAVDGIVAHCLREGGLAPRQVLVVDDAGPRIELQELLPDSTCPTCGTTPRAEPPSFTPAEVPLTKLSPRTLRTRRLPISMLRQRYLHPGTGLFKEFKQDLQSPFGASSVELTSRRGRREPGIGRALTYEASQAVAVLEGLERYAGLHRGGRVAQVRACYRELGGRALDPRRLGTHAEEGYNLPGFPYRRFDPATVVDWVPARSLLRGRNVLVPERAAFWGPRDDGEVSFFYDTSNGSALGSSPEEAVLHGLREVAERDAFLLTWYRGLRLPKIRWRGFDPALDALVARASLFTGFSFQFFHATMDHGLPSVVIVATADADDGGPATFAGAGAHPDPHQAIIGGVYELVGTIMATRHAFARRRADGLAMLAEPDRIRRMEDHALVASLPEARERFAFLLDAPDETVDLPDLPSLSQEHPDLRADLRAVLRGFAQAGLDVLVVDQTMPELSLTGLHCTRVIVPGTLPMTFGHRNRRTVGLSRLVRADLPYPATIDAGADLGAVPHPFP